jgi:hypothetical protein
MKDKINGGPAFPVPGLQQDEDFNGMTLRDYFAASVAANDLAAVSVREDAEALAGRARPDAYPNGVDSIKFNMEVEAALRMMFADAMLVERAK